MSHEEDLTQELSSAYGDKYGYAQYKLWAKMIINKHSHKDNPPNNPMMVGKPEKEQSRFW